MARVLVAALVMLAFALRLPHPGSPPPGLYHDEAYNGLDAAGVLDGHLQLYFPDNNGREPIYIYMVAAFVAFLGRSPAALRLASAFVGTAAVAATFAVGAALASRRAGLLAAALLAVAPWPVILGRVGFRAGVLPLVLAMAVAASIGGCRRRDTRWLAVGGALAGLTLYTYTAARLAPLMALGLGLWALAHGRRVSRRSALAWVGGAALVALPLLLVLVTNSAANLGRSGQVSIFNPAIHGGDPWSALSRNIVGTLGMLVVRGDPIARHNLPFRPMLDPPAGALSLVGLAAAVVAARGRWRAALVLIWLVVMSLPTFLAESSPHFLRAAGVLPAVMLLPALGAGAVSDLAGRAGAQWRAAVWLALALGAVVGELASTYGFLTSPARSEAREQLYFAFEAGAMELSADVNEVLASGWTGGWAVGPPGCGQGHPVWLDRRLRDGWASVPYLAPVPRGAGLVPVGSPVSLCPSVVDSAPPPPAVLVDPYDPILVTGTGVAFLWPHALDLDAVWSRFPPGRRLEFRGGSWERADLSSTPERLYVRAEARAAEVVERPVAVFANGVRLLRAAVDAASDGAAIDIEMLWGLDRPVGQDVTAFVQVLEGDSRVAGSDAPLGSGLYGVPRWRPGDQVVERRELPVAHDAEASSRRLILGIYAPPEPARIAVLDAGGAVVGDHVELGRLP